MITKRFPIDIGIFSCVQLILYILMFTVGGNIIRYLIIISSALFSGYVLVKTRRGDLTFISFLFTLSADFCLVILDPREQLIGMIFFCGTQILLALRAHSFFDKKRDIICTWSIRAGMVIIAQIVTAIVLGGKYDALSAVSVFYFCNLALNMLFAFVRFRQNKILSIGLLMFVLCDIFVGVFGAVGIYFDVREGSFIYMLANPPFDVAWMFYAPSQTLLAISTYYEKRREKHAIA